METYNPQARCTFPTIHRQHPATIIRLAGYLVVVLIAAALLLIFNPGGEAAAHSGQVFLDPGSQFNSPLPLTTPIPQQAAASPAPVHWAGLITATVTTTPTVTITPTITLTPTITITPTVTLTPTPTATPGPSFLPLILSFKPTPTPTPISTGPFPRVLFCSALPEPLNIPDDDETGVTANLGIVDPSYLADLDVYVNIQHSRVGDLVVSLVHQDTGTGVSLLDRPGIPEKPLGCERDDIVTILDDQADLTAEDRCLRRAPTLSGSYRPAGELLAFTGEPVNGAWTLQISDNYSGETGRLLQWCLEGSLAEWPPAPIPTPPPVDLPTQAFTNGIYGQDQALPLDCESRSAVDWAAYLGGWINEFDFFNNLPVSDNPDAGFVGDVWGAWGQIPPAPYGVHARPIAELLQEYGLDAYAHRYLPFDRLRQEVAEGRPAIVWVIGSSNGTPPGPFYPVFYVSQDGSTTVVSPYEHTVLFVGYTENEVSLLDGDTIYTRTVEQFLESWAVLRNMAVLATP